MNDSSDQPTAGIGGRLNDKLTPATKRLKINDSQSAPDSDKPAAGHDRTNKDPADGQLVNGNHTKIEINSLFTKKGRTRANPFKLIPCERYTSDDQAPFTVRLSIEALSIIDIHAHCLTTEVIGLLGGVFCKQTSQLFILTAEPCLTIDDHNLQCEMDPVSQAMASERLQRHNYQVVGWYHSHPTFVPNPSLRDIETQARYQRLFSLENSKPFIALILSPYSTLNQPTAKNTLVSKYKVITLVDDHQPLNGCSTASSSSSSSTDSHDGSSSPSAADSCPNCPSAASSSSGGCGQQRCPYELTTHLIRREKLMFFVTDKLKELLPQIVDKATAVSMMDKIRKFRSGEVTYLQKLLSSLKYYLELTGISQVEINFLLDQCRSIFEINQKKKRPTTSGTNR